MYGNHAFQMSARVKENEEFTVFSVTMKEMDEGVHTGEVVRGELAGSATIISKLTSACAVDRLSIPTTFLV